MERELTLHHMRRSKSRRVASWHYLHRRHGIWYIVRRVPKRYQPYDTRKIIMLSTGIHVIDDPMARHAGSIAAAINAVLEANWIAASTRAR